MTLWIVWSMLVSSVVALAAVALDRAVTHLGAPRRFVWIGAMIVAAVAPFGFALSYEPVLPAQPMVTPSAATSMLDREQHDGTDIDALASAAVAVTPPSRGRVLSLSERIVADASAIDHDIDPWVVRLWLAASFSVLVVFGRELWRLRRQRADWREAELDSCAALIAADAGPAVVGFTHPRIVVPEWTLSLDRNARALLLRHETEHIQAGDPRMLLGGLLLLVAMPWNGALWWMSRQLRLAIEIDCDARVIRAVGDTRDYGMVLIAVSERFAKPLPFAASLAAPRLTLERRINAMTAPRQRRPVLAALPFGVVALMAITVAARAPRPAPLAYSAMEPGMSVTPLAAAKLATTAHASMLALSKETSSPMRVASAVVRAPVPSAAPGCALSAAPVDSADGLGIDAIVTRGGVPTDKDGVPLQRPYMKVDTVNTNTFAHLESQRDAQGLVHGFVILVRGSDGWTERPVIMESLGLDGGRPAPAGQFLPDRARIYNVGMAGGQDVMPPSQSAAPSPPLAPAWIAGDSAWPGPPQSRPGRGGQVNFFRYFEYGFGFSFQTNTVNYEYGNQTVSLTDGNVLLLSNVNGVAGPPTLTVAGCIPITPAATMVARALASVKAASDFVR